MEGAGIISDLPEQVLQGMDTSHSSYCLDAFNCDQPEDVVTQSIPESCNTDNEEPEEDKMEADNRQDYTILQKVTTFEYPAMLCNLRRSQHYYDCVWKSHVRVAAPARIYVQETLRTEECLTAYLSRTYYDQSTGIQHTLQPGVEVHYL